MKIQMLSTQNGSIDGIHVASYPVDSVHDLSESKGQRELASAFIGAGMAIQTDPPDPENATQTQPASAGFFTPVDSAKAIDTAPENKMIKRAYNRKAK